MKPSEQIMGRMPAVLEAVRKANPASSPLEITTAAFVGAAIGELDDLAERQRRRFEVLGEAIESGAISGLKERAREEGLL